MDFQEGFLSYPRTETDQFVEGTNLHGIVEGHVAHHDWGGYAHRLLADNKFQCAKTIPHLLQRLGSKLPFVHCST